MALEQNAATTAFGAAANYGGNVVMYPDPHLAVEELIFRGVEFDLLLFEMLVRAAVRRRSPAAVGDVLSPTPDHSTYAHPLLLPAAGPAVGAGFRPPPACPRCPLTADVERHGLVVGGTAVLGAGDVPVRQGARDHPRALWDEERGGEDAD